MSYEKQNFVNDQTLTADHLNHIEDGIEQLNQELQGYATKDDLNLKADKAEIPSIEGLATEDYVAQEINNRLSGLQIVKITQAKYNALTTKDPNTLYLIVK